MICSAADQAILDQQRRRLFLALFTALAVVLHTLEVLLPSPLPWFRFGFANIFGLLALFLYGPQALLSLTLSRVLVGSVLLGQLFSPGFLLSLGGGLCAAGSMSLAHRLAGARLSAIGVSALGAAGHVLGQLLIAWLVLVRHPGLWQLFPYLLLWGLAAGVGNGLVAAHLLELLGPHPAFATTNNAALYPPPAHQPGEKDLCR